MPKSPALCVAHVRSEIAHPSWPAAPAFKKVHSSKTLTSFNKESGPFFLDDNSIWSFLSVEITAFAGPESYFSLAIIAFGAFEFIVHEY